MNNDITISFILAPGRVNEITNAINSIDQLGIVPKELFLFFNPVLKYGNINIPTMMGRKYRCFTLPSFHSISYCWNQSILLSETPFTLICNDDIVFKDKNVLEKIVEQHKEGYDVVSTTDAWSATSFSKNFIKQIGWFDERIPYSFEDIDKQIKMIKQGIKEYRFNPKLIEHVHSPIGRDMNKWSKSSDFFFKKWDISPYIGKKETTPEERFKFIISGEFDKIDRSKLVQLIADEQLYEL